MATLLMCTTSSSLGQTANRQSVPSRYVDIASWQKVVACQIAGDVNWHYQCVVNWVVTKQYNRKQRVLIFWRLWHLNKVQELSSCWDGKVGRKVGDAAVPLSIWRAGSYLTQCRLGRGLPPYQVTSWSIQPFGHSRRGPKNWGCCTAPFRRRAGSPSNTMWPGPRPTCVPSGILIYLTVWSKYTNVTDRQTDRQTDRTGQDNGPIA